MSDIDTKSCHKNNLKKYHFIAVGGVGQSALAKILLKLGYEVSGSDIDESKYTKELKDLGAKIFIGHKKENVPPNAQIVLSSAIKEDNVEYRYAVESGLKIVHRSDMLKEISDEFGCFIGFSGTHGKTTTSGLMSYILTEMGQHPSYAVGGIIPNLKTNADANKVSSYFVAELDESDGTIIKYHPDVTVINNLEADHIDFYKNGLDDVLETFSRFLINLETDAKVLINADDTGCLEFIEKNLDFDFITYGINNEIAKYMVKNIEYTDSTSSFDVYKDGDFEGNIVTSLKGMHNVYNTLSVIATLFELNFKFEDFNHCFQYFTGMGRRFESVFKDDSIEIIDDYAHHPTEIKATLKAASDYTKGRVVAVFQPHRYTRLKGLWEEFAESFKDADLLIVTDVFSAGDEYDSMYNSKNFADEIKHKCVKYLGGNMEEIAELLPEYIKDEDVVLTIGAGDITNLGKLLRKKYARN